jgi:hypothetical protein
MNNSHQPASMTQDFHAAAELHHRYLTGLILALVVREGEPTAAEAVYRLFRRQHREKFLPGLKLLGIDGLPDAVASAQYHYLSNFIGTVKVEYMPETDRKAWIRYPPPRWIFDGTAICGIPDSVTVAMMRGWHARNGEALGNPNLGFVCTGMTTAGDSGLEGYFIEEDAPLAPANRLRFAADEHAPPFDPAKAPSVDHADWPADRLAKAERNYAMDFVRVMLDELTGLLGDEKTVVIGRHAARQIGMQFYDATRAMLDLSDPGRSGFVAYLERLIRAMGDNPAIEEQNDETVVTSDSLKILAELESPSPAVFDAWNGLWEGARAAHDPRLALHVEDRRDTGGGAWRWRIAGS